MIHLRMALVLAASLGLSSVALAQDLPDAKQITLDAPIASVTLYRERAMITRGCALPNEQGTFEVRIEGLPESIDAGSLSARVEGGKLLDVRYETTTTAVDVSTSPELKEALAQLERLQRVMEKLSLSMAKINDQNALLNSIAAKTATESAKDFGSKALDPAALAQQVLFLETARTALIEQRLANEAEQRTVAAELKAVGDRVNALGGKRLVARAAIVSVGKPTLGSTTLAFSYLVDGASWSPDYAIRALDTNDDASDRLTVEFSARIAQRTGEDWSGVSVTLSTAEPTRRPAPNEIPAEFLEIAPEEEKWAEGGEQFFDRAKAGSAEDKKDASLGRRSRKLAEKSDAEYGGVIGDAGEDPQLGERVQLGIELQRLYADAAVDGGAVVTYALPRAVTIPSDRSRTRTQRIATIELTPEFSHVARPIVDPVVYLRAKARNTSGYRLLEGRARLFVGEDSVGEVTFPTVIPGAEVNFWLGGDARLESKRVLVSKETKEDGVFGKSLVTTWKWRIDLTSAIAGSTKVELDDRIPVSRNEAIKVELRDLSLPLSTDEAYLKGERTRGILRWTLELTGLSKEGKPSERSISWTVRESHSEGVEIRAQSH